MARLLILEDDAVVGFQLKRDIEEAEHEVEICLNATGAIEELTYQPYDLLISDIIIREDRRFVPDGGIKLCGWVRRNPATRNLPIIAITRAHKSPGMQHILVTAEQVGANASLEKPFHLVDLLARI